jgi:hypothetical protein
MLGKAVAAAPLAQAGLGTLTAGFPGARPETVRVEALLRILAEETAAPAAPDPATRAMRP